MANSSEPGSNSGLGYFMGTHDIFVLQRDDDIHVETQSHNILKHDKSTQSSTNQKLSKRERIKSELSILK